MVGPDLKVLQCGASGPGGALWRSASRGRAGAEAPRGGRARVRPRGSGLPRARRAERGPCAGFGDPPARNWAPPGGHLGRGAAETGRRGGGRGPASAGGPRLAVCSARDCASAFWGDGAVSGNLIHRAGRLSPPSGPERERRKGRAPNQLQSQLRSGPRGWCLDSDKPEPRQASRSGGGSARGPSRIPSLAKCPPFPAWMVNPPSPLRAAPLEISALRSGNLHFLVCKIVQQMWQQWIP